ncbi:MAG: phosphatase PAP2 family protein [Lachnospiraceae bacterium]|nr:phosphatase PAP2 family protein [Lachnospiraceae bacterium]
MDGQILLWLQDNLRNPVLDAVFVFFTYLGNAGIIWGIVATVLILIKATRKAGVCCFIACFMVAILNEGIIKHLVNRPRPFTEIDGLSILIRAPGSSSFPSGHTATAFAVTTILFLMLPKKYSFIALVVAGCISFSRMYVGVHYPTDVLGGLISGIVCGFMGFFTGSHIYDRSVDKGKDKEEIKGES